MTMRWATYLFISQGKESTEQCKEKSLIQGGGFELISVNDEHSQEVILNCNDEKSNQLMQILEFVAENNNEKRGHLITFTKEL